MTDHFSDFDGAGLDLPDVEVHVSDLPPVSDGDTPDGEGPETGFWPHQPGHEPTLIYEPFSTSGGADFDLDDVDVDSISTDDV